MHNLAYLMLEGVIVHGEDGANTEIGISLDWPVFICKPDVQNNYSALCLKLCLMIFASGMENALNIVGRSKLFVLLVLLKPSLVFSSKPFNLCWFWQLLLRLLDSLTYF